jgi:hypothetical protein
VVITFPQLLDVRWVRRFWVLPRSFGHRDVVDLDGFDLKLTPLAKVGYELAAVGTSKTLQAGEFAIFAASATMGNDGDDADDELGALERGSFNRDFPA